MNSGIHTTRPGDGTKLVAVVTPHVQFPLQADQRLSLRHLRKYLGHYDRYVIGPRELPEEMADFTLKRFPSSYFASVNDYSRLLVSRLFYESFREYRYILIYQLDCLVFSSDLDGWCDKGWDYVGAPWMAAKPWIPGDDYNDAKGFWGVGNGGLSLRNVGNALKVLESRSQIKDSGSFGLGAALSMAPSWLQPTLKSLKSGLHALGYKNTLNYFLAQMASEGAFHEDLFWAMNARHFYPGFRIPSPQEAVCFSFEAAPRYCFTVTGGRLPFGCHAWPRFDRDFWEPYLLK